MGVLRFALITARTASQLFLDGEDGMCGIGRGSASDSSPMQSRSPALTHLRMASRSDS